MRFFTPPSLLSLLYFLCTFAAGSIAANEIQIPLHIYIDDSPTPWKLQGSDEQNTSPTETLFSDGHFTAPTGGSGQPLSVFSSGSPSGHTSLVFEGLELRDPSLPSGGSSWTGLEALFGFGTIGSMGLNSNSFELTESSLLQGSGSAGGLLLRVPEHSGETWKVGLESGFKRVASSLRWSPYNLQQDGVRWQSTLSWLQDGGFSAAADLQNEQRFESDQNKQLTAHSVFEKVSTERATKAVLLGSTQTAEFDAGPGRDDPNAETKNRTLAAMFTHSVSLSDTVDLQAAASAGWGERKTTNEPDPQNLMTTEDSRYEHHYLDAAIQLQKSIPTQKNRKTNLAARIQSRSERIDTRENRVFSGFPSEETIDKSTSAYAAALGASYRAPRFLANGEAKLNKWESRSKAKLNGHTTVATKVFSGVKKSLWLRSSVGLTVQNPSLYQLHSVFGNPNLQAEETRFAKIGAHLKLTRMNSSLSYTAKRLKQLIDFRLDSSGEFAFENISEASIQATQLSLRNALKGSSGVRLHLSGNWLKADRKGQRLVRRPVFVGYAKAGYQFTKRHSLGASLRWVGNRIDVDELGGRIALKPVHELSLDYTQPVSQSAEAGFQIENILDQKRQQIHGYQRLPLRARMHFSWRTD